MLVYCYRLYVTDVKNIFSKIQIKLNNVILYLWKENTGCGFATFYCTNPDKIPDTSKIFLEMGTIFHHQSGTISW